MSQEGRSDEAQRKRQKNHCQRRPVLGGNEAKEMQDGHVDKVMAEEKNRYGNEKKYGNERDTSRPQGCFWESAALGVGVAGPGVGIWHWPSKKPPGSTSRQGV